MKWCVLATSLRMSALGLKCGERRAYSEPARLRDQFTGRNKAEAFHIELAEDILAFLAQRVRTNVRRLEGALMRVASYHSLSGREISRETVEQLLRDILREEAKKTVVGRHTSYGFIVTFPMARLLI